jgi:hypothetical protein
LAVTAAAVTDHVPPDAETLLKVCSGVPVAVAPENSLTVTVDASALWEESAVWAPAVPEMVGVVVPVALEGAVTAGDGAAASTTKLAALLWPWLPAPSDCDACTVYCAFAGKFDVGVADHSPPLSVVVSVCSGVPLTVLPE